METAAMECDCDATVAAAAEKIVDSVSSDSSRVETPPSPPPEKKPKLNPIDVLLLKATDAAAPCIESPSTPADTTPKRHPFSSDSSSSSHDSKSPTPTPEKKLGNDVIQEGPGNIVDDEELDEEGYRKMTDEEYRRYYAKIKASGGFDVEYFPNVTALGLIEPCDVDGFTQTLIDKFTGFANLALVEYNLENDTNFKCAKIIKVNGQVSVGFNYYITFKGKPNGVSDDDDSLNQVFQAKVLKGIKADSVDFCRLKP